MGNSLLSWQLSMGLSHLSVKQENRRRKSKIRKKSLGYASAPTHPIYGREGALLQVYPSSGPRTITGLASVGTAQPKHKQKEPNKETNHARSETHQKQRQQRGGAPRKGRGEQTGFFFRPTPLGFRQVVQHVRLHVAEISELIN